MGPVQLEDLSDEDRLEAVKVVSTRVTQLREAGLRRDSIVLGQIGGLAVHSIGARYVNEADTWLAPIGDPDVPDDLPLILDIVDGLSRDPALSGGVREVWTRIAAAIDRSATPR